VRIGPRTDPRTPGFAIGAGWGDNRRVSDLPSGTVSLLFTDIEGSTQLQHHLGERYHEVVAEHRRLLEESFAAHGGTVVDRQTESFFVAFARARHAVQAAAAAQRAFADHTWPDGVQVKVRMGIHAGEPDVAGDRYVGLAVSRAARICASAHGGQVLLSSSARALLSDDQRAALRGVGVYRLKDFTAPEPISQLVIDGLPSQFPRLRTEAKPDIRKRLLLAAAALVAVGGVAGAVVALTDGSSGLSTIGPTSVGVIDPKTNQLVDEVPLGFKSSLVAAGEEHIWVVDPKGSTLWKINPRTREKSTIGIAVGAGAVPFGIAVGRGAVWLAVLRGSRQVVLELGPEVGDLRRTIPFGAEVGAPILSRLQPLAVGGAAVWAVDAADGAIWRIDPRPGAVAEGLDASSLAADAGAVWAAATAAVTKIDAATGQELGRELIASSEFAATASIALGLGAVWFARSSAPTVWRIDPETASTTQTLPVGRGPSGIAVGEGAVWIANSRDETVSRVDPTSGRTTTVELGAAPGGIVAAYGAVWTSPGEVRS
jgi:class 3 adenylate cyclase/DNA-binding beta-propeller fold protein YncE